jgi:hypothetical protein
MLHLKLAAKGLFEKECLDGTLEGIHSLGNLDVFRETVPQDRSSFRKGSVSKAN